MKPVVALAVLPLLALAAFAAAPAQAGGINLDFNLIFGRRHCAPPPVIVERRVVVERPVCVERPVMVERRVYVDRPVIVARPVVIQRPVCAPPPRCDQVVVVQRPARAERAVVISDDHDCRPERRVEYHEARRFGHRGR